MLLRFIEHGEHISILHRRNCHEVDAKHQSFDVLWCIIQVRSCLQYLRLNGWYVSDLQQRVDVVNVDLPQLKDLDGVWVDLGDWHYLAADDKGEPIFVAKELVEGLVYRRTANFVVLV